MYIVLFKRQIDKVFRLEKSRMYVVTIQLPPKNFAYQKQHTKLLISVTLRIVTINYCYLYRKY